MNSPYVIIPLVLISQLLTNFLLNYFSQKGKNLADKDDIANLTELTEEVKNRFSQENEYLKSTLSIIADKKSKSYTQGQQAIIAFYTEINTWIWDKTKISIHEYGFNDIDKLNQKIIEMNQCHSQVNIYNGSMDLLVNDPTLTKKGYDLIIEVLKLHQFVENKCRLLKAALQGEATYVPMVNKYGELSELMKNHVYSHVKELQADKDEAVKNFYDQRTELLNPIFEKLHEFKNLAKLYLLN